jgi:hypothetical protein
MPYGNYIYGNYEYQFSKGQKDLEYYRCSTYATVRYKARVTKHQEHAIFRGEHACQRALHLQAVDVQGEMGTFIANNAMLLSKYPQ